MRAAASTLLRLRVGYFVYFLYLGTFGPLWTNWVTRGLGHSSATAGTLALLLVAGLITFGSTFARLADRWHCRRRFQRGLSLLAIGSTLGWLVARDQGAAFFLMVLHAGLAHPHVMLLDATTIDALGPDRHRFGSTRLYGTLGYGTAALLVGLLREGEPRRIIDAAVAFMTLFHLVTWWLPDTQIRAERGEPVQSFGFLKLRPVRGALGAQLLVGISFAPYEIFGSCYFEDIGLSNAAYGRLLAVGILSEVVVFAWAPRWLSHHSAYRLAGISVAVSALRWLLIVHFSTEIPLLVLQLTHGVSFGLWYASVLQLLAAYVSPENRTFGQACFGITLSAGYGLGGFLVGRVRGDWPAAWIFGSASGLVLLAGFLLLQSARQRGDQPESAEPTRRNRAT